MKARHRWLCLLALVSAGVVIHTLTAGLARQPSRRPAATVDWQIPQYTITDLAALFDSSLPGGHSAFFITADRINNRGDIAGTYGPLQGGPERAYLFTAGRFIDLGGAGGLKTDPHGLNDKGEVVGEWWSRADRKGINHLEPFIWSGGKMRRLGRFGGESAIAWDINNKGQIAIGVERPTRGLGALIYDHGKLLDLGG